MSGLLSSFEPQVQRQVLAAVHDLPSNIGLIHQRTVVPVMLELRVRRPLNMINAETLAVAVLIGGVIGVSTESPLLRAGATDLGFEYRLFE